MCKRHRPLPTTWVIDLPLGDGWFVGEELNLPSDTCKLPPKSKDGVPEKEDLPGPTQSYPSVLPLVQEVCVVGTPGMSVVLVGVGSERLTQVSVFW